MTQVVRAASLRGWSALVLELGGNPPELLRRCGLSRTALDEDDALVPARAALALVESSAIELDCPDFGLRLGDAQDPTALGPLALVAQNAPNVREMIESATRYLFVHSQSVGASLVSAGVEFPDHSALVFDVNVTPRPPARQGTDIALATAHRLLRTTLGDSYRPRAVLLSHTPAAPLTRYVRHFGTEVHPERSSSALILANEMLQKPLANVDEAIRRMALSFLETHYPTGGQSTSDRARLSLARLVESHGYVSVETLADALGLHPRTLQRRLADEGTSFLALKDARLSEMARQYLTDTQIPLAQIARALGLSDQSALTRSVKRWFGRTPTEIRRARE